jgi:hypothetical protein
MDGSVTPRAIAYSAVQVCNPLRPTARLHFLQLHFNLTDAIHWTAHYNRINYEESTSSSLTFSRPMQRQKHGGIDKTSRVVKYIYFLSRFCPTAADIALLRTVFQRSAATRAAAPTSVRRTSLAVLRQQRQLLARFSHPRRFCSPPDVHLSCVNIFVRYESYRSMCEPCDLDTPAPVITALLGSRSGR